MIIRFSMKNSDIIDDAHISNEENINLREKISKWFSWGEYLDIEYDTKKDKMVVQKNRNES